MESSGVVERGSCETFARVTSFFVPTHEDYAVARLAIGSRDGTTPLVVAGAVAVAIVAYLGCRAFVQRSQFART